MSYFRSNTPLSGSSPKGSFGQMLLELILLLYQFVQRPIEPVVIYIPLADPEQIHQCALPIELFRYE